MSHAMSLSLKLLWAKFNRFGFNSYSDYLHWNRVVEDLEYELSNTDSVALSALDAVGWGREQTGLFLK